MLSHLLLLCSSDILNLLLFRLFAFFLPSILLYSSSYTSKSSHLFISQIQSFNLSLVILEIILHHIRDQVRWCSPLFSCKLFYLFGKLWNNAYLVSILCHILTSFLVPTCTYNVTRNKFTVNTFYHKFSKYFCALKKDMLYACLIFTTSILTFDYACTILLLD